MKKLLLFFGYFLMCSDVSAQVPDAVLKSKELSAARQCMKEFLENGKKANLDADGKLSETFVLNPTREPLVPIAAEVSKCMSAAFPNSEIRKQRATNLPHRVWWVQIEGIYIFCATPAGANTKDGISPLGGNGPKRAWLGVYFRCNLGKEIAF
jgi:hypothetical protein